MFATHIHDPKLWFGLISPRRNLQLPDGRICEVLTRSEQNDDELANGVAPYADILTDYAMFVNATSPVHAWPWQLSGQRCEGS